MNYWSHIDKLLEVHICGVIEKSRKYTSLSITEAAALFHDFGKINPNFQKKLAGVNGGRYSNHSYLSVFAFVYFAKTNGEACRQLLKAENTSDYKIKFRQVIALIAHHHGDLPNFVDLLNWEEITNAAMFVEKNELPFSSFLSKQLSIKHNLFSINYDEFDFQNSSRFVKHLHLKFWRVNALRYFMDTQFGFASLIHADKRDAGNNVWYQFEDRIPQAIEDMDLALARKFQLFDQGPVSSDLNRLRTAIRVEATKNISRHLLSSGRVFTITAPTGAGKTYTLLSVAKEIQRQKGPLGIIYALPFLSITEQVQRILDEDCIDYLPVNSKVNNQELVTALELYEVNPTLENLQKILQQDFAEHSFDHPFIITTFVQFFETLVSNKNATLLKLPNFSNRIFLIDELQALPPRLYIFFSAWLEAFCRKNNSYVILSTATMPKLDFPEKDYTDESVDPYLLFKEYSDNLPIELITPERYFSEKTFNRYKIYLVDNDKFMLQDLVDHVLSQTKSCLVILNTIGDTKELYEKLEELSHVILLNTHFTPSDRSEKIKMAKAFLNANEKVILISTQLIEAGVDIDFPVVYRDLCPLPSLIQSAGRCNRNNTFPEMGDVYFFQLKKEQGKASSEVIYKGEAAEFLRFCKEYITDGIEENKLYAVQSDFFSSIRDSLSIGDFKKGNKSINMIECVNNAEFERLGEFQLIDNDLFGEQYKYYIPKDENDFSCEELADLVIQSLSTTGFEESRKVRIEINNRLKGLSDRIINVRLNLKKDQVAPAYRNEKTYFDIRVLSDLNNYSFEKGLELGTNNLLL